MDGCVTRQGRGGLRGREDHSTPIIPRKGRAIGRLIKRGRKVSGVRVASPSVGRFRGVTQGCNISCTIGGSHDDSPPGCLVFFGNHSTSTLATTFARCAGGGIGGTAGARHPSMLTGLGRFGRVIGGTIISHAGQGRLRQ